MWPAAEIRRIYKRVNGLIVAARKFFDAGRKAGPSVVAAMHKRGVIARAMPQGDILGFAPPLCLTNAEADVIVAATVEAVHEVLGRS